jgi:hypothetical protein
MSGKGTAVTAGDRIGGVQRAKMARARYIAQQTAVVGIDARVTAAVEALLVQAVRCADEYAKGSEGTPDEARRALAMVACDFVKAL